MSSKQQMAGEKRQTVESRQQPADSTRQTEKLLKSERVEIEHQQPARSAKAEKREAKRRPSNPELYNWTPSPRKGGVYSFHLEVYAVCCISFALCSPFSYLSAVCFFLPTGFRCTILTLI
jgi:hypothetical protein